MSYVSLVVSVIILLSLFLLNKKKLGFGIQVFTAMILGIIVGAVFKKDALLIEPLGTAFVNLIKMLVIPLVVSSLISSMTSLDSSDKLKKISFKTIGLLILTTVAASAIGILVGNVMNLGRGVQFAKDATFEAKQAPTFISVLLDMVPVNPVNEMANAKIIPVIMFSMLISAAIMIEGKRNPEAVKLVKDLFNSLAQIMFRITRMIISLTPYGVYGLMVPVSAKYGLAALIPLSKVILAVYIACVLQMVIIHGGLITFVAKVSPLKFFKRISSALIVAFTTRSSYGTLPVTMKALTNEVKISDKIVSFAAPLGASIGMNGGGGIYPALIAIFVANVFNIDLTITHYILLLVTTAVSCIGIAGVPGAAIIGSTVVLSSLGLPVEGLAMVLGIDVIVDMARTMTNVAGASIVSLLVAAGENEFDRNEFNKMLESLN
jgi:uncharacterized protein